MAFFSVILCGRNISFFFFQYIKHYNIFLKKGPYYNIIKRVYDVDIAKLLQKLSHYFSFK